MGVGGEGGPNPFPPLPPSPLPRKLRTMFEALLHQIMILPKLKFRPTHKNQLKKVQPRGRSCFCIKNLKDLRQPKSNITV